MKPDLYFERRKFFFNEISAFGISPDSDFAFFIYDKFCQNIIKYKKNEEDLCLKETVEKYGKIYKNELKNAGGDKYSNDVEENDIEPVDYYIKNSILEPNFQDDYAEFNEYPEETEE